MSVPNGRETFMIVCRVRAAAARSRRPHQQPAQTDQVVGGRVEREDPVDKRPTAMVKLAQQPDGFHPPKRLLDQLPFPLTDLVAGMARRAAINGTATARGLWILRDVGCDTHGARRLHEIPGVVVLVAP